MNEMESKATQHRIIVGLDYSELGDLALERACDWAALHDGTQLHVLHAVSAPSLTASGPTAFGPQGELLTVDRQQESTRLHAHVEQIVQRWCDTHSCPPSFERLTTYVRVAPAAEAIAELAADIEAELVIVGTHGRRGIQRLLLGSVSEATIRLAACDVLVVRPPDTIPLIEPPCPRCVEARRATNGSQLWCEQHLERHGRRHTYHYSAAPASHQSSLLIRIE